jgi:hypothetical protein
LAKTFKLIRREAPKRDESLMGYILRLTKLNGYETPAWIMRSIGLDSDQLSQTCSFLFRSPEDLNLLSEVTGINVSTLAALKYAPMGSSGTTPLFSFFGFPLPRPVIRPTRPKVCPRCLAEKCYHRRMWDFTLLTACPEHEYVLIDECPNCGIHLAWARRILRDICYCGFDLREGPLHPASDLGLRLSRHIYRLFKFPVIWTDESSDKKGNPALALCLQDFISAMTFITKQSMNLPGAIMIPHFTGKVRSSNADIHSIFSEAFSVFINWPVSFYRFLNQRGIQKRKYTPSSRKLITGFPLDLNKFCTELYEHLPSGQFDFMRMALCEYLSERRGYRYSSKQRVRKVVKPYI